ncbi:MAG: outer membrane protein assembly factor BamA [Minwuia sp.]|uniref:outer membrane protein assembly factor BamA n=1 Tax=Minwuia sp. TaxID=2493630 RepID=UPI003A84BDF4
MLRRFAIYLSLCLLLPVAVAAQSAFIRDIAVEGNQRVSAETVRSYMRVESGQPFDRGELDEALKRLYATGLFADVTFRRQGDVLVVAVVENPIINRIAFEGNKAIDDETLDSEVRLRPRIVYTRSRVQSDVQRLLQLYRASGRFAAVIEPKIIQLPQNRINLVFEIDEGSPTDVRAIRFLGNRAFDDSDLRKVIATSESAWYKILATTDHYDPDLLALDRERLRQHYLNNGYVDFRVVSAVAELTPDRKDFFITFTVEEGEQYAVSTVDVEANIRNVDPEEIRGQVEDQAGETYSAKRIEDAIQDIKFGLGEKGFAFVEVRPRTERNREDRTIALTYRVSEGPRVYVERIDIEGNTRTLDPVVRREMRLIEGDAFDTAKLEASRRRLRAIDYFSNIEIKPEPGSREDRAVVKVEVEEQPTGELSLGAGFSTSEAIIGDISIRERNLLGRGQDIRLGLSLSLRRREVDLSFTEPYFLGQPIAAGFDIFNTNLDFQDESSFDQNTTGLKLRSGVSLSEATRFNVNYQFRRDNIKNVGNNASQFIKQQQGVSVTSSVGYTLRYDKSDDPITPSSGFISTLEQEFAGLGGNVRDVRTQLRHAHFFPITDNWVLQVSGRGGAVVGVGKDIRINRRFFVGGDSFRGFAASGIGPRDIATGDALGGEFFAVGTTELRFPLGLPDEFGLSGRVFTDYGTAFGVVATGGVEDDITPRMSVGVGVTWRSPFGPMLFDLSQAVIKNDIDETEVFRFSFGTRF